MLRMLVTFFILLVSLNQNFLMTYSQGIDGASGSFKWMRHDKFDTIMEKMSTVNPENCNAMSKEALFLPYDTLSQLPQYNTLPRTRIFANRSSLLHLHQTALSRGYFFSLVLQRLNGSEDTHPFLPGLLYYYFSTSSDVSANPGILNGSAVLMDFNLTYPNFYTNFYYNRTIPFFGPKAFRLDDFNDETNWVREPTNNTILVKDYGAGPECNYTAKWYKTNPYVSERINFIPDWRGTLKDKHQYTIRIRGAKAIGELEELRPEVETNFFGPPSPGQMETELPVKFTQPYYDCGKSDKWIVTAVAPIVDIIPRYSRQKLLIKPRMVGIITTDIDFLRIDFNPCPAGEGNPDHMFAGTARCKPSTMCEPLPGFGFKRGGYQCHCKPGYRYPFYQNGPFQGVDIEQATEQEYRSSFDCITVRWRQVLLSVPGVKVRDSRRRRRSVEKLKQKEGPYSRYNRLQFRLSLTESQKRMPYVETKPDRREESLAMRWYNFKNSAAYIGQKFGGLISQSFKSVHHFLMGGNSVKPGHYASRHNVTHPSDVPSSVISKLKSRSVMTSASASQSEHKHLLSRHKREVRYGSTFQPDRFSQVEPVINKVQKGLVNKDNCHKMRSDELIFPGEVGYGAETQFEGIGRSALRLSHFLSGFLQNTVEDAIYGDLRGDRRLNEYQLYSEVFSNVMADLKVQSCGIFFDRGMFVDKSDNRRQYFAPYAYRERSAEPGAIPTYEAVDYTGVKPLYIDEPWFKRLKEQWASNTYGLERFVNKPWVRSNPEGDQIRKFDNFPLYYHAPKFEDGFWTQPYFDCKGFIKDWVITYSTPFFGNSLHTTLKFMGVVTITVKLKDLDINQCPGYFYSPNFFKNTAVCHFQSTHCVPIPRRGFNVGGYKCDCRQGFEYHFTGISYFYDGQLVEAEYRKRLLSKENRYELLKCREAGALGLLPSHSILSSGLVVVLLLMRNSL